MQFLNILKSTLILKDHWNFSSSDLWKKNSHPLNVSPVSSEVSMSERVNIIILNDPLVVVFWKGKFFWLSHYRLHACGFLSHMFFRNGRTTGSSFIIYFLMMCLYLFLWQNSVNLIDGLSINRGKLTIGSYVSVRSSGYEARGKFGEHERCVRVA